jgi:hypothetical protein
MISRSTAAVNAAAGIVSTHAHTIRPAIPQRTADNLAVAPQVVKRVAADHDLLAALAGKGR